MGHNSAVDNSTTFGAYDPPDDILGDDRSDQDIVMGGADEGGFESMDSQRDGLIVAIDFGTTFSSVAYARTSAKIPREFITLKDVKCITNFPDSRQVSGGDSFYGPQKPREEVPSELWYYSDVQTKESMEEPDEDAFAPSEISSQSEQDSNSDDGSDTGMYMEAPVANHELRGSTHMFWGFGVQKELRKIDIPKDGSRRLTRFKLMLDEKEKVTEPVRKTIDPILKKLKRMKVITQDNEVITHYLEQLLKHAKAELERLGLYHSGTPVEFVLTVPAVWPIRGVLDMQKALTDAVKKVSLGSLTDEVLHDLFIVSEPEAAAMCVLTEDNCDVQPGEYVLILDAGGGTIDAITYQIASPFPLRFDSELVKPGTKLNGGSYINERYRDRLLKRLAREKYLERSGRTIPSIVDGIVIDFENKEKKYTDTTHGHPEEVVVHDLQANKAKSFTQNRLIVSPKEMKKIFKPSLDEALELLKEQLDLAQSEGCAVTKVILVGGFGESPALRSHLRRALKEEECTRQHKIDFLLPDVASSTVVARGAILRALNKENGPARITNYSYGFLRSEPHQPDLIPAHVGVRPHWDKTDGEKYVDHTIEWLIQAGTRLPRNETYTTRVRHTIPIHRKKLECKEQLWMSDERRESHYRFRHTMNKGSLLAGEIVADMTFLRDEGRIQKQPTAPRPGARAGAKQLYHWAVEFDLVMIIDGRNLRYEARYPPLCEVDELDPEYEQVNVNQLIDAESEQAHGTNQTICATGRVCIAAAFKPGTA